MPDKISSYRDLKVWQLGMDLAEECYRLIDTFPTKERYAMSTQIWRASSSVPANIAEGHSRGSRKEFIQFLWISHGSLKEFETHLLLCSRVGLTNQEQVAPLLKSADEIGKMLRSLIKKLSSP